MQREPITPQGLERLRAEIKRIRSTERPAVIEAIAVARAHGDLKENAEYHAAKDKQGLLEARLNELENLLAAAQVIDCTQATSDNVIFGSTVTVYDALEEKEKKFQIVGKFESDIKNGKIPVSSPIAKSLIGKTEGDEVTIRVPKGIQELEILKIEYL
jgi:transcription elongation factor GreA